MEDRRCPSTTRTHPTPPHGLGRRGFLTLAVAGAAASAFTVTVGTLAPGAALAAEARRPTRPPRIAPRKRELRAMWISSVVNIDWPSRDRA